MQHDRHGQKQDDSGALARPAGPEGQSHPSALAEVIDLTPLVAPAFESTATWGFEQAQEAAGFLFDQLEYGEVFESIENSWIQIESEDDECDALIYTDAPLAIVHPSYDVTQLKAMGMVVLPLYLDFAAESFSIDAQKAQEWFRVWRGDSDHSRFSLWDLHFATV